MGNSELKHEVYLDRIIKEGANMLGKHEAIKELIEGLRGSQGTTLSRENCLILANLIEEQLETIKGQQSEIDWLRSLPLSNE